MNEWYIDWIIDYFIWFIDINGWLTDWLVRWLIDCLIYNRTKKWLTLLVCSWLVWNFTTDTLIDRQTDCKIDCTADYSIDLLIAWSICVWLTGWESGWLAHSEIYRWRGQSWLRLWRWLHPGSWGQGQGKQVKAWMLKRAAFLTEKVTVLLGVGCCSCWWARWWLCD